MSISSSLLLIGRLVKHYSQTQHGKTSNTHPKLLQHIEKVEADVIDGQFLEIFLAGLKVDRISIGWSLSY